MDDLDFEMQQILQQELNRISERIKAIFIECIEQEIYDRYTPSWYDRTYQLKNNVEIEINDGSILVYVNPDNMDYYSAYNRERDVTEAVPWFLTQGHKDNTGINNWFHNYPKSNYLEVAKERIQNELGLECEIINEKPSWV